jgi:hypothetical protein
LYVVFFFVSHILRKFFLPQRRKETRGIHQVKNYQSFFFIANLCAFAVNFNDDASASKADFFYPGWRQTGAKAQRIATLPSRQALLPIIFFFANLCALCG